MVATLGPATRDEDTIRALVESGVNVARLNFSHGTHEEHATLIERVRAAAERLERTVATLADLQGPRLRVGPMAPGTVLSAGAQVRLDADLLTMGDARRVGVTFWEAVADAVAPGQRVLLSDGDLELVVEEQKQDALLVRVKRGGALGSRKGMNLPETDLELPSLTDKDRGDLAFALEMGVDYVALSFVRSAADVELLRSAVSAGGGRAGIVAKIERPAAVAAIGAIVAASDAVMVARGDLALEIGAAAVPLAQKRIIATCRAAGVPVITATQMLESMIAAPHPTRAETSDVANAILDGTDAVMLSGETAIGRYPVAAVREMVAIAHETESALMFGQAPPAGHAETVSEAVGEAAVVIAMRLGVAAVAAATTSGSTARMVARFRPAMTLAGVTTDASVCRRLALVWGVVPVAVPRYGTTEEMVQRTGEALATAGLAAEGDRFVVVSGQPLGRSGSTNMVQVRRVGDWRRTP